MSERVWVITGTSSGIGLAIAHWCLVQGDKVVATVRSLTKFPEALKAAGAHPLVLDMDSSDEDIRRIGEEAIAIYGRVDVLVNNAGTGIVGPVEEQPMKEIRHQFQINLFSHLAFTQPFITHFRTRRTGFIINISSIGSLCAPPSWGAYCGAKAALDAITDTLSKELMLFNVRVLSVLPGYFVTNIFRGNPLWADGERTEEHTAKLSKIYTDPITQGYDSINNIPRYNHSRGRVGDPDKLAARLYEVVTGTGMAEGLVPDQGGKRDWTRIIMGPDCGESVLRKLELMTENVKVFEPMWRSTNMDLDQLKP